MKTNWQEMARVFARTLHERYFHFRWGVWYVTDKRVSVVFNNAVPPSPILRDKELAFIRERLAEEGIDELAYATWPVSGPDDGYSYAMVVDAGEDRQKWLDRVQFEATVRSYE